MLLAVVAVEVLGRYRVRLTFNDGVIKEIDFSQHWNKLFGPIFQPLRDPALFAQVMLPDDSETIEWPNGADLAAEFLYEIGETIPNPQPTMVAA